MEFGIGGNKNDDKNEKKKLSKKDLQEMISAKKNEIITHCENLAQFKVSSAIHVNESTKELLRLKQTLKGMSAE